MISDSISANIDYCLEAAAQKDRIPGEVNESDLKVRDRAYEHLR